MNVFYSKKFKGGNLLKSLLLVLLFSVAGLLNAQEFTVGDLNYSVNEDGVSVAVTGHVNGAAATGTLTIPETVNYEGTDYAVTTIGAYAFYNCVGLTGTLTIPNSVTIIEIGAFMNCPGFTGEWAIPNAVTEIRTNAFQGCSGFTGNLNIPNTVTEIGGMAFQDCTGFTGDLTFPSSVVSIGSMAFLGCTGFSSFSIPNTVTDLGTKVFMGTVWYNDQPDGVLYKDNCCLGYKGSRPTGDLQVAEGTRLIAWNSFDYCDELTSVTFPNSLNVLGRCSFQGCHGLTSVTLPNSLSTIDHSAFSNCSGLTSVTFPNSLTTIGNAAFNECTALTSLTFPNTLNSIGADAFYNCTGLTSVTFPNSLNTIGSYAFEHCTGITSFDIPNSVTSIGFEAFKDTGWYNAQENGVLYKDNCCIGCKGSLPSDDLQIEEGTRLIATSVFRESGITSLTLPNSLRFIGSWAFEECWAFDFIESRASTPPALGEDVFYNVDHSVPVTIPNGALEAYQSAPGWSEFTNWVEAPVVSINEIRVEGFTAPSWGMHPDFNVAAPVGAPYAVDNVVWYYDNDEMASGDIFNDAAGTYYMLVYLTPEVGYAFDPDATVLFNGDASINDAAYNTITSDGTFEAYTIDYQVTPPSSNIVSEIRVEGFTAPSWGEHPDFNVTVPAGAHYTVDEVAWYYNNNEMASGSVFNDEGGTYYMLVVLAPEMGYAFDPEATVLFNGDASVNDAGYNAILSDGTFAAYTVDYQVTAPAPSTYSITAVANPSVGGTVTGGGTFSSGETCTLTASANSGYTFLNWTKNGAEVYNRETYRFTVTENAVLTANFIQSQTQTYILTVSCDPSMGAVTGNGTYAAGTVVTVEAIPYKGYVFDRWNDGVTANPRNVTMNGNMTLVAFFNGTGLDENGEALLGVYPNPAKENLRLEGIEGETVVEIFNSLGERVKTLTVTADEEINVSDLPQGIYMVRCGQRTVRFVKA